MLSPTPSHVDQSFLHTTSAPSQRIGNPTLYSESAMASSALDTSTPESASLSLSSLVWSCSWLITSIRRSWCSSSELSTSLTVSPSSSFVISLGSGYCEVSIWLSSSSALGTCRSSISSSSLSSISNSLASSFPATLSCSTCLTGGQGNPRREALISKQ